MRTFVCFGEGGGFRKTIFVRFAGLLPTFAMAPYVATNQTLTVLFVKNVALVILHIIAHQWLRVALWLWCW